MNSQTLVRQKVKIAPTRVLAERMMPKFKHHIGYKNSISKGDLFKFCFGARYNPKSYADFFKADRMRVALHYLRVNSTCFVTSYRDEATGERMFSVVSNAHEAEDYCAVLGENMKKMRSMQDRARKAAAQKWHEGAFVFTKHGSR